MKNLELNCKFNCALIINLRANWRQLMNQTNWFGSSIASSYVIYYVYCMLNISYNICHIWHSIWIIIAPNLGVSQSKFNFHCYELWHSVLKIVFDWHALNFVTVETTVISYIRTCHLKEFMSCGCNSIVSHVIEKNGDVLNKLGPFTSAFKPQGRHRADNLRLPSPNLEVTSRPRGVLRWPRARLGGEDVTVPPSHIQKVRDTTCPDQFIYIYLYHK